jgi:hypothetical protein
MQYVVGGRATEKRGRLETAHLARGGEILSAPVNLATLMDLPGCWVNPVQDPMEMRELVLDMDSPESPTYGK